MTGTVSGFRHEVMFYRDEADFVARLEPFVREGLARGEALFVAVRAERGEALKAALGRDGDRVFFADMATVGRNPAAIIPFWLRLLSGHAGDGRAVRAVGEPVWDGRSASELEDCHLHEALLNRALRDAGSCWLVCPYETSSLGPDVLETARRTHPYVWNGAAGYESGDFHAHMDVELFRTPLREPLDGVVAVAFAGSDLAAVRDAVAERAAAFGLRGERLSDLVFAVHELAANSVRHGGGAGTLRMWSDGESLVCEVRDAGVIDDPLVGRRGPEADAPSGRGLWLVNQLADLVQVRSTEDGTTVRISVSRG